MHSMHSTSCKNQNDQVKPDLLDLLSDLRPDLVPQWRQEVMGFVAVGPREFIALEPALGGRGGVGWGVGLEVVFDLARDHLAGSGNSQCGGLDFFPAASGR